MQVLFSPYAMNGLMIRSKIFSFSVNFVTWSWEMDGSGFDKGTDSIQAIRSFIQSCYEYASIYFITPQPILMPWCELHYLLISKRIVKEVCSYVTQGLEKKISLKIGPYATGMIQFRSWEISILEWTIFFYFHSCLKCLRLPTITSYNPSLSFHQCSITSILLLPARGLIRVEFFSLLLHFFLNGL